MKPEDEGRCPNCVIGRLRPAIRRQYASQAADTLTVLQEDGRRCSLCGHEIDFTMISRDGTTVAKMFGARCDFCGDANPVMQFPCRDFTIGPEQYLGAFAACPTCRDMVLGEDREGLVSRAISQFAARNPKTVQAMLRRGLVPGQMARSIQDGFWRNRITETPTPEAPIGQEP
jgi:hypothetical protein